MRTRKRTVVEERLGGAGHVSNGTREEANIQYSLTILREMLDATAIGDTSRQEIPGLMNATGTIILQGGFNWLGEGDLELTIEDGRKIGVMVSDVDIVTGRGKVACNGGWIS